MLVLSLALKLTIQLATLSLTPKTKFHFSINLAFTNLVVTLNLGQCGRRIKHCIRERPSYINKFKGTDIGNSSSAFDNRIIATNLDFLISDVSSINQYTKGRINVLKYFEINKALKDPNCICLNEQIKTIDNYIFLSFPNV